MNEEKGNRMREKEKLITERRPLNEWFFFQRTVKWMKVNGKWDDFFIMSENARKWKKKYM